MEEIKLAPLSPFLPLSLSISIRLGAFLLNPHIFFFFTRCQQQKSKWETKTDQNVPSPGGEQTNRTPPETTVAFSFSRLLSLGF
jgi:hypothetical protein